MALQIGKYVISGELRNTRRNGVFGWLEFAPDYGIRIELTGNFSDSIASKHLRFSVPANQTTQALPGPPDTTISHETPDTLEPTSIEGEVVPDGTRESDHPTDDALPSDASDTEAADTRTPEPIEEISLPDPIEKLADRQIGVVGEIQIRNVSVPTIPLEEFQQLADKEKEDYLEQKPALFLEWFSQNGQVVAEIVAPQLEFVSEDEQTGGRSDAEALEDGGYGVGFTEVRLDNDGDDQFDDDEEEDDDPYGLFSSDLEEKVAESLGDLDLGELPDDVDDVSEMMGEAGKRNWGEVIPGLDADTKAMYEQWDEIFEGKKDEPVAYLFQEPLRLPKVENVKSDDEARPLVKMILAQLALLSVALDVCEHYSPMQTYDLLMKEILPTAKVHPNLAASEMVQHYSTSDFCQLCEDSFDEENDESKNDETPPDSDSDGPEGNGSDGDTA